MKGFDLTVLSVVETDSRLLELMIQSIVKFTDPIPKFIICDNLNGGNKLRINKFKKYADIRIVNNIPKLIGGSNRHGSGINKIFSLVKTKYFAIIESDVVVLHDGWWKIKSGYQIKAANKGNGLYHMCFFVAQTNILKGMDFRAGTSKIRGNSLSYSIDKDVGWQLSKYFKESQVDFVKFVDCKGGKGKIFGSGFQSDEFQYNGTCIAAHYGRGSNIAGKSIRKGFKSNSEQLKEWKEIVCDLLK